MTRRDSLRLFAWLCIVAGTLAIWGVALIVGHLADMALHTNPWLTLLAFLMCVAGSAAAFGIIVLFVIKRSDKRKEEME